MYLKFDIYLLSYDVSVVNPYYTSVVRAMLILINNKLEYKVTILGIFFLVI